MNRLSISKIVHGKLGSEKIDWIKKFVIYAKQFLSISEPVIITLLDKNNKMGLTTGGYDPDSHNIYILAEDRAVVDICRTIAHEMSHMRQGLDNRITDPIKDGEDGSEIENEANAKAGEIIRKFGRKDKTFYII
jgi:hypothetical protein